MKAAPFEYSRPADLDEACALLAADDSARVIAGGQTLVPMMVMRLARPTRLIDINRIAALSYIRNDGDGVAIGATTRQCVVERDALVAAQVPLLARAIPNICHAATRASGETAEIPAREFFIGPMITILPAGGCLTAARSPREIRRRSFPPAKPG